MEIKKELTINTSTSRVYDAITDMKQLSQWFPDVVSLDPKLGGKIEFKFSPSILSENSDTIEGKIIELEKNKKLVYTWSHPNVPDFPITKVSWNLEQITKNKTKVIITHSGFVNESTMNSYNKKWLWITEHLSSFTVSENPVNMRNQMLSILLPELELKAFHRIKKARKALVYITIPLLVTVAVFALLVSSNSNDLENEIIDKKQFQEMFSILLAIFIPIFVSFALLSVYLMRKWSNEWNQKFLESKNKY